ncbi:Tad domain-containing protein [Fodinisporobacter ferrooxydans]|uniref:Tad domain-containing protein n=1 Tax=Fodinisporobacter ferrooxydans TaxID=2901836 RepID=A0ABY4CTU3_9BACL|nr:Tad domain-containing protein [Alicyclobacillaceae bacterium MYW30-H2]
MRRETRRCRYNVCRLLRKCVCRCQHPGAIFKWRSGRRRWSRKEEGTVIIIVALMMTALLGFAALVIDGGRLFLEQSKLQKALDAAVLAGAQDLPLYPDQAKQDAMQTMQANQITADQVTISFNTQNTYMKITAAVNETLTFAHALGFSDTPIQSTAAVQLNPLAAATHVIPLGVNASTPLSYGSPVELKTGDSSYGNFGALALSGPGANNYREDLTNGYSGTISIGDVLGTQTGNIVGPTIDAIQSRIASCPYNGSATYYDYPNGCPLVVLVPVYQPLNRSGNQVKQVKVVGFATFFIESVGSSNQNAVVTGRFLQRATIGSVASDQSDYGTYGYKLVQ